MTADYDGLVFVGDCAGCQAVGVRADGDYFERIYVGSPNVRVVDSTAKDGYSVGIDVEGARATS